MSTVLRPATAVLMCLAAAAADAAPPRHLDAAAIDARPLARAAMNKSDAVSKPPLRRSATGPVVFEMRSSVGADGRLQLQCDEATRTTTPQHDATTERAR